MIITHLLLAVLWIIWCTLHSAMISLTVTNYLEHRLGQFYRLFFNAVAVVTLLPVYLYSQGIDSPLCLIAQGPVQIVRIALLLTSLLLFVMGTNVYDLKHFTGLRQIRQKQFSSSGDIAPFKTRGILTVTRHPWYLGGIFLIWTYQARMTMADVMVNAILSLYFVLGAIREENLLTRLIEQSLDTDLLRAGNEAGFAVVPSQIFKGKAPSLVIHHLVLSNRSFDTMEDIDVQLEGIKYKEVKDFSISQGMNFDAAFSKHALSEFLTAHQQNGLHIHQTHNIGASDATIVTRCMEPEFKKRFYPIVMGPGTRSQRETTPPRLTHGKDETFDKKSGKAGVQFLLSVLIQLGGVIPAE